MKRATKAASAAFAWALIATTAHAQAPSQQEPQSRSQALLGLRQLKATRTTPYQPGGLEKGLVKVESERLIEDWLSGAGGRYYVKFGGITTGAGFGLGPGFRLRRLAGGHVDLDASAVVSYRRYLLAQATVTASRLGDGPFRVGALARQKYFPQEDFFGLGPEALRPERSNYLYQETAFGAFTGARWGSWLDVEGRLEFLNPDIGAGRDSRMPSTEQLFTDAEAPGLATQPDFLMAQLSADFNYATPTGNPRRGGRYMAAVSRHVDRAEGQYSFNRVNLELRQYLPFLHDRRVLALRALASFSDADDGAEVPFYLQRSLGGGNSLRGFRDYRFRDRNVLLLQAEYRWEIFPALDAALFYDAGKVGPTIDVLDDHMESDYGFGFRFGTNRGVFLRIDASFGSRDGKRYFIKWNNIF
jgi:hypothetical protein